MSDAETDRREGLEVRASNAERDRVVDRLGAHFAAGRLTTDELAERLDAAHAARARADLARLEHDLPMPAVARAVRRRPAHGLVAARGALVPVGVVLLTVLVVATGGFPWPLFLLFAAGPFSPCRRGRMRPERVLSAGR